MRAIIVVVILCLLNGYIAARIIDRWPWAEEHAFVIWGLTVVFYLLQLLGPFGDRLFLPVLREKFGAVAFVDAMDWISYVAIGVMSCLFIYSVAADIISMAVILLSSPETTVDLDRRALLAIGTLTVGSSVLGVVQAESGPIVREVEIPLKNLPPAFNGFKIVQISDLHVSGTIGRDYTQNVVNIANGLKPDLIALTGDFVDGSVEDLAQDLEPIAELEATHGKFYITGNHEYYWGAPAWIAEFKKLGARVLTNEHELISIQDDKIILAGVTDYSTIRAQSPDASNPKKALEGAPVGLVKILLAHQPASYQMAHEAGFDLQLSGHTHAGQYFPFSLFIRFFQHYYKGLNRHKDMWVYVNSGTGYWGPPMRTANPSEITLIVLRPETA